MSAEHQAPEGRGTWGPRAPMIVVVALVSILAGLGVSVAAVAGVARGVRAAGQQITSSKTVAVAGGPVVTESMEILTGEVQRKRHIITPYGVGFGPMYTNTSWAVHVGDTVVIRITSYDDGPAPLTGSQIMLAQVHGTVGGIETVDGRPVSSVANDDITHTFTVPGLGLNMPIPAAPTGGSVTVVARYIATRSGTFTWQCYAPCGSGPNSMGGPMSVKGWMEGTVRVLS